MNNCLRCVYVADVCKHCGRKRGEPKPSAPRYEITGQSGVEVVSLSDLVGPETLVGDNREHLRADTLPAHSPLGASGAKRWMNCPGSTELIKRLGPEDEEDPDYRRDGTQAHELAARCLDGERDAWELIAEYPELNPENAAHVQTYFDYVRSRPGRRDVEVRMHRPQLHELFYGTVDCALVPITGAHDLVLEIIDLKFGEGVYVAAEENEQLMYYAIGYIDQEPDFYPDEGRVRLTIVQPRMMWAEPIRSWDTTIGELKRWAREVLLPAMYSSAIEYQVGEWCRFCPAKLVCPKMQEGFDELAKSLVVDQGGGYGAAEAPPLQWLSDEDLGHRYELGEHVKMYLKALAVEVHKRLMDRKDVPGAKLVAQKVDRAWKDEAETQAKERFGQDAYTSPKLLSPAQMEKLPKGKDFVSEWAFKPEAGYTVALATDKRNSVTPKSGAELFAGVADKYLTDPA